MKTVLITGISRGIGRALAEKFLIEGHKVIGTTTTGTIDFTHPNMIVHQLDLSVPESIDRCCADICRAIELSKTNSKTSGPAINILVNNAGALFDDDETSVVIDKLRKTLEVNLIGTIDFTEHIIPVMKNDGHIICISSSAGSLEDTDMEDAKVSHWPFHYPAYKISKCALNMYVRTLAMRLQHVLAKSHTSSKKSSKNESLQNSGEYIIVSAIHPGWVKTSMGGEDADLTPEEAAANIYKLAISRPETGQFWFKDKKRKW
jgi:NAD(P)-dependent dehydrogenase (short-subunit alcohol dehydrogenase family)